MFEINSAIDSASNSHSFHCDNFTASTDSLNSSSTKYMLPIVNFDLQQHFDTVATDGVDSSSSTRYMLPATQTDVQQNTGFMNDAENALNTHPMVTRSKIGVVKPKLPYAETISTTTCSFVPATVTDALKNPTWYKEMKDEFQALHHNSTWSLVPTSKVDLQSKIQA